MTTRDKIKANLRAEPDVQWVWHIYGVADVSTVRDDVPPGTMVSPMSVECAWHVPWWQRFITRLLFRSVWERPSIDYIIENRKRVMAEKERQDAALAPVPQTPVEAPFPVNLHKEEIGP